MFCASRPLVDITLKLAHFVWKGHWTIVPYDNSGNFSVGVSKFEHFPPELPGSTTPFQVLQPLFIPEISLNRDNAMSL